MADTTQTDQQNISTIADQLKYPLSSTDQQILREALGITQALPVGAIFISAVTTNPSTLLGYGTWSQFAQGQVLVGFKSGDANFGTLLGTGGEATHTLTQAELPAVTPSIYVGNTGSGHASLAGAGFTVNASSGGYADPIGSGSAHNNLQPSVTVYMWQRTA